jgi:nucleotide-binding universal stress UspA family protein
MTDSTQSQGHAARDTSPPMRLHVVVGYDGTPPASRALDAAIRLLRGREGSIEVSYVAHVPGLDMLSADAIVEARAGFDEIEKEVRGSAAARLDGRGVAWEFRRRDGLIANELIAAATASRDTRPGASLATRYLRGMLEQAQGRDAAALAAFQDVEPLVRQVTSPQHLALRARAQQVHSLVRLGQTARAGQILDELAGQVRYQPEIRIAAAALRIAQDDPSAALAELAQVLDNPFLTFWDPG